MFTAGRILQISPQAPLAVVNPVAEELEAYAAAYGVTTPKRCGCLVAQLAVESAGFSRLEENLNYTHAERIAAVWPRLKARAPVLAGNPQALANAAYAGRNGNGDEASGDGWHYRGRGLIQITGLANYAGACQAAGVDLVANPAAASDPATAARIALWFWQAHGCNELADAMHVDGITLKINGPAMEQANVRRMLSEKAVGVFQ